MANMVIGQEDGGLVSRPTRLAGGHVRVVLATVAYHIWKLLKSCEEVDVHVLVVRVLQGKVVAAKGKFGQH